MTIESMTPEQAKAFTVSGGGPFMTTNASAVKASYGIFKSSYVGGYRMENTTFALTRKPSRWHRWWVRWTLGWVWEDAR